MATVESPPPSCARCHKEQESSESTPLRRCSRCRTARYCSKECQAADWHTHKKRCGKPPRPTHVVLLSLEKTETFETTYRYFLPALKGAVVSVQEITTEAAAAEFWTGANHRTPVIATDAALARKGAAELRAAAVHFVQDGGGTIVFGCDVPGCSSPPELEELFTAFSLPWRAGYFHRTAFRLNRAAQHVDTSSLIPNYDHKALHLAHVEKKDAVYLPTRASAVWGLSRIEDLTQTPAAFRACGTGWIGYTGDVDAHVYTILVTMAMCGLVKES